MLIALIVTSTSMHGHLGRPDKTAKFKQMFSNNRAVNILAAARIFLFAARDVWFVVGLPFFLYSELGWSFWAVGTLLAVWVIGYGAVQAAAPRFVRRRGHGPGGEPDGRTAVWLALGVAVCPAAMAVALDAGVDPTVAIVVGLIPFGVAFAMNSAVHSYLILAYADNDKVAMNVGFYYMANASGASPAPSSQDCSTNGTGSPHACGHRRRSSSSAGLLSLLPADRGRDHARPSQVSPVHVGAAT